MIKTTVKSINAAKEALKRLAKAELPARVSYTVARLIRAIDGELALYEVQRIKLCEKYGEINAEGTRYIIKDAVSFTREHTDLENTEVELNAEKVVLPPGFCITAGDLMLLEDYAEVSELE